MAMSTASFKLSLHKNVNFTFTEDKNENTSNAHQNRSLPGYGVSDAVKEICFLESCYLWEEARRKNQVNRLGDCFVKITMELFHRLRSDKLTSKEKVMILNFLCESGALQMDVTMCCGGENSTNKPDAETYSEASTQTKRDDERDIEYMIHGDVDSPSSVQSQQRDKRITDENVTQTSISALLKKISYQISTLETKNKEVTRRDIESDRQPCVSIIQDNSLETNTFVQELSTAHNDKSVGDTMQGNTTVKHFQSRKQRNISDSAVQDDSFRDRNVSEVAEAELMGAQSSCGQSTRRDFTLDVDLNSTQTTVVPKVCSFWSVEDANIIETAPFQDRIARNFAQHHGQETEPVPKQEDCCYIVEQSQPTVKISEASRGSVRGEIIPMLNVKRRSASKFKFDHGARPFKCGQCSLAFQYRSRLTRHMKSHTGEKPSLCQICGKGFTEKFNLRRHMKVHNMKAS
ncbi:zinc finger protein 90-like [Ptychodera flava]|uniref:zinc finger protein 90-like n=1 Tax=Ptychodera flava TaxID=63121 RepID=UPI00396A04AF